MSSAFTFTERGARVLRFFISLYFRKRILGDRLCFYVGFVDDVLTDT
jgi:hypothetical protein